MAACGGLCEGGWVGGWAAADCDGDDEDGRCGVDPDFDIDGLRLDLEIVARYTVRF